MKGARLSRLACAVIICLLETIDVEGFHQRLMRQTHSTPTWELTSWPTHQVPTDASRTSSYSCTALYGIPKMFRWLTDLYPDILNKELEVGLAAELDVDNFYLDMNGIIHPATHGNAEGEIIVLDEAAMFKKIFLYVDRIYKLVRPQKVLYLAVDGVAPRAKMNQQRSRRFRSAKDAEVTASEILARSALKGNRELPADILASRFDSNCITPGTDFMLKLSLALQRWVEFKMASDPFWKAGASVIVSGPDVPGEGEHKVMDFIRDTREAVLKGRVALEDPRHEFWGPNYTHVLYGLDADLIMLGLVTHEPSFMLLREKMSVVMAGRGRNKYRKKKDMLEYDKSDFEVLDLNSLRQMLAIQFRKFADPGMLRAPFDLNRIIDDFVFMCMLVGNDFLPHCPHLEIDSGAISMLMSNYVDLLAEWGDYLTKKEKIHPERLEQLMYQLSVYEEEHFKRRGYEENEPGWKLSADEESEREDFYGSYYSGEPTPTAAARANRKDGTPPDAEDRPMAPTGNRAFRRKHPGSNSRSYRDFYYETKLGWKPNDRNRTLFRRREHVREYMEGLHWVLNYYHNGCRSWNWYFSYLYSPLATDMVNLREFYDETDEEGFGTFSFDMGEPFPSLAQLLSVLPPQSAQLLPQPLAELMTHPSSPLQEYYPPDFTSDANGKRQSWEAVVQIPFIDGDALLDTVQQIIDADSTGKELLTPAERRRNVRGKNHVFVPPGLSEEERQSLEDRQSRIDAVAPRGRRKRVMEEDLERDVSRSPAKRSARTRPPPS